MAQPWSTVEQSQQYQALPQQEQQAAKQQYFSDVVSKNPGFVALPDDEKTAAQTQFMGTPTTKQDNGITGQDISQHPFQSVAKTVMQPMAKSLTGKSLEDMAREKSLAGQDVPAATSRPFDANLGNVQDAAFKNSVQAQAGDALTTPANYAGAALIKGGGQLLGDAGKGLGDLLEGAKNVKDPAAFAQNVRSALFSQKQQVGKTFGDAVDKLSQANPNVGVDLSEPAQSLKNAMADQENNPGLAGQVKGIVRGIKDPDKAKLINDIIEDPTKASNLTLQQSNDIKTAIQNSPSISSKLKQGKFAQYTPGDLEVLDLLDNVKLKQGEVFPELADIRKPYAQYMQNYNQVKNMFKPGTLIGKIKNGFGDEEKTAMVQHILPGTTSDQIDNVRKILNIGNVAKTVGKETLKYAVPTAGLLTGAKILSGANH